MNDTLLIVTAYTSVVSFIGAIEVFSTVVPAMRQAYKLGVSNTFTRAPFITFAVFFIMSTLIAPLLLVLMLFQRQYMDYASALHNVIIAED